MTKMRQSGEASVTLACADCSGLIGLACATQNQPDCQRLGEAIHAGAKKIAQQTRARPAAARFFI
jgi:hypothetical protein